MWYVHVLHGICVKILWNMCALVELEHLFVILLLVTESK
jgi:hypothetical protein